jgi:single-strand DNA-binding protein
MAGVNKVILIGNLGRDPELKYTNSGTPVCRLSLATTRAWTNKEGERSEETEWHRVTVWGKQAEHCNNYLQKGRSAYVEGRLKTSSYEEDGVKKWSTEVIADTVQFLGGRGESNGNGGGGNRGHSGSPDGGYDPMRGGNSGTSTPSGSPSDDDIPF